MTEKKMYVSAVLTREYAAHPHKLVTSLHTDYFEAYGKGCADLECTRFTITLIAKVGLKV